MPIPSGSRTDLRRALLGVYAAVFFWSLIKYGIPVDRIAVLTWMLVAFLISSIGRTRDDVKLMVRDWVVLVIIYMIYDYSRGTADQFGIGVNYTIPRDIDRFIFFGRDPNVWLQSWLLHSNVRWYDVAGSIIYMMHFILPVVPLAMLRVRNRLEWLRYVRRFALTLYIAVASFIVFPSAPPWMAAQEGYTKPVYRITGRGWWELHLKTVSKTLDRGAAVLNSVAAMPSLHAGMALLVALWFTRNSRKWIRVIALAYPLSMAFTLIYFGEHWAIDTIMGWVTVLVAWKIADRWEQRRGVAATPDQFSN
jgi:membrane-associated phospholipid phosphatase